MPKPDQATYVAERVGAVVSTGTVLAQLDRDPAASLVAARHAG
ncbi:hypothetical protein [Streptomyces sp. NPDC048606]